MKIIRAFLTKVLAYLHQPQIENLSYATLHGDEVWLCPPPSLWSRLRPHADGSCYCNLIFISLDDLLALTERLNLKIKLSQHLQNHLDLLVLDPGTASKFRRLERIQAKKENLVA